MSKESLFLRFDGPALKEHTIDVTVLGPSIGALGLLCKEANLVLNGGAADVKVLIEADIEGNCITLKLMVVQGILKAVRDLVENKNVETAKNLLEWLDLIKAPGTGLLRFLIWKKDRKVESQVVEQKDGQSLIRVTVHGDNNTVLISPEVFKLSQSKAVVEAAKEVVSPVNQDNGITEAVFYQRPGEEVRYDQDSVAAIQQASTDNKVEISIIKARISVYAPVLDEKSKKWRFTMLKNHHYMDISETTIAADTMKRGGVRTGDSYLAEIEVTETEGKDPEFKVKKVLEFRPGQNLAQMLIDPPPASIEDPTLRRPRKFGLSEEPPKLGA